MRIPAHVRALLHPPRPETRIAVVGASHHRYKFGHIILQDLRARGFTVLPVNPSGGEIAGLPVYARLDDIPGPVHIVNFVVPPKVGLELVTGLDPQRYPLLWFQPGADSSALVEATRGFETVVMGPCIMVEAG